MAMTIDLLAAALEQAMSEDGVDANTARELAEQVMNFFGYDDRFPDNFLRADDRDLFNTMEELGILNVEAEDTTLMSGKFWRVYYWMLNFGRIETLARELEESKKAAIEAARKAKEEPEEVNQDEQLYDSVPDDIWQRD